jgi:hypothetical protein
MTGIFISCRRDDSAAWAGRLYDQLVTRFGDSRVFMDIDDIARVRTSEKPSRTPSVNAMFSSQ